MFESLMFDIKEQEYIRTTDDTKNKMKDFMQKAAEVAAKTAIDNKAKALAEQVEKEKQVKKAAEEAKKKLEEEKK